VVVAGGRVGGWVEGREGRPRVGEVREGGDVGRGGAVGAGGGCWEGGERAVVGGGGGAD
jgi:hypothetical protein